MKVLFGILALLLSLSSFATPAPFHKEVHERFNTLEGAVGVDYPTTDPEVLAGYSFMATAKATYTPATLGGTGTTDYALGVSIPPNSAIVNSFYRVVGHKIVSANDNTIAVKCEAANDIITAVDMTDIATGAIRQGSVVMGSTAANVVTDGCELTVTIGAGASGVTAGELDIFVQYVSSEY
jgi:hypothetical protein